MTKLDDPLFGTKREEPSTTRQESKLDDPMFGSNRSSENPYVSSQVSEQRRRDRDEQAFNKRLQREIKYGRVSQESRARLASEAMNSFVNQVIAQKSSSTQAINHSSLETQADKVPTVTTTQSPLSNDVGSPPQAPPRSGLPDTIQLHGCPYDLKYSNGSSNSSIASVRHTACIEGVGNNVFDRYTALQAQPDKVGVSGYFGEGEDGYFELATKGQAETYLWGYADQGDSNFRARAFGAEASLIAYTGNNANYVEMKAEPRNASVYGFADDSVYNFLLGADGNANSSYLRVYGQSSNVYATVATKQNESFLYGYADNQSINHRVRSTAFKADIELWSGSGPTASMWATADEAGMKVANPAGDSSYVGLGVLFLGYASGDYFQAYGNGMILGNTSGSSVYAEGGSIWTTYGGGPFSQLYGGGLYISDGGNFVQINPPGDDAYFQQVNVCVNGEQKTAMVLMTKPQ